MPHLHKALSLPAMFMDRPFIIILKTLELHGVGQFADIAPTLLSIYTLPDNAETFQKQETSQKITSFLTIMEKEGLLSFDGDNFGKLGSGSGGHINWLTEIKIMATIGTQGLNYLSDDRNQKMVEQLNQSVIDTNRATTKNFRRQTFISAVTILIAALTAWIAWLTYQKTKANDGSEKYQDTLKTYISPQKKDTIQVQHQKISPTSLYKKKDST